MEYTLETGPIRPPSEAASVLLRLTRNCPWNQCAFCPTFKDKKFSMRSTEEVINDIDTIRFVMDILQNKADETGRLSMENARAAALENNVDAGILQQVLYWLHLGMKNMFLQDGDSLVMKTENLLQILNHVKTQLPSIERITTYARAATVARRSIDELKALRAAGLNRLHIGMESGADEVLALIKKGVTSERQILAGQKAVEAGFEVSLYFMPGIGGREYSREHALASAKVINAIKPAFVRIRSIVPMPGTPLYALMEKGEWTDTTERERVAELELMIQNIDGVQTTLFSDHIANLLEEVEGTFPNDKEKMLGVFKAFWSMSEEEQDNFILGRRIGYYRRLADNKITPDMLAVKRELINNYGGFEPAMRALLQRYI